MKLRLLLALSLIGPASGHALAKTYKVGPGENIQAAVDLASAGDTIEVKGVHYENVVLALSSLTLRGKAGATIDGQYLDPCVEATGDDIRVMDLTLLHGTNGIDVDGHGAHIEGNLIRNAQTASIQIEGDDATLLENDVRDGGGVNVVADNTTSVTTIEKNETLRCDRICVEVGAFVIRKNDVRSGEGIEVRCDHPSVTTRIQSNELTGIDDDAAIDVAADGDAAIRIESNTIERVNGNGVDVYREGAGGAVIKKNDISQVSDDGFDIGHAGSGFFELRDNTVVECGIAGYCVGANSTGDLELTGGSVRSSLGVGLFVEVEDEGDFLVSDVEIRNTAGHGIQAYDDNLSMGRVTIQDCDIRDCVKSGIMTSGGLLTSIVGCRIRRCRLDGIDYETSSPSINENVIRDCGQNGIRVAPANPIYGGGVARNDIRKCGADGIVVVECDFCFVSDNVCRKNRGDGIDFLAGGGNWILGNVCCDNLHEGIDNSVASVSMNGNVCLGNGSGLGPDIAGAGKGTGSVGQFDDNEYVTGGPAAIQRLDQ